eukprot:g2732.t1
MQEDIFKNMYSVSTNRSAVDDPKELSPLEKFFDAVTKTFNADQFDWDFPAEIQSRNMPGIEAVDKENMTLVWEYIKDNMNAEKRSEYYPLTRRKARDEYMKLNAKYNTIDDNIGKSGMHSADYKNYHSTWESAMHDLLYYYMMKDIQGTVFGDVEKKVNVGIMTWGMSSEDSSSRRKRKRRKKNVKSESEVGIVSEISKLRQKMGHFVDELIRKERMNEPMDEYDKRFARVLRRQEPQS